MKNIRKSRKFDLSRILEIEIFNYRINFYPIFKNDKYYFGDLQVLKLVEKYSKFIDNMYVYDDDIIKGFIKIQENELQKLFVEPVFQRNLIGTKLLNFAIKELNIKYLWALEKNNKAIEFYKKNGFHMTNDKKFENGTTEYLVRLEL